MVVPSPTPRLTAKNKRSIKGIGVPVIDLSEKGSSLSKAIVEACEESGMFKVVNHGVSMEVVMGLEKEALEFFSRPPLEKQLEVGPATAPFGYGCKSIGFNGDVGQLEYLLLHTHPCFISNPTSSFGGAVRDYVRAVRELACEVLDRVAEGLWAPERDTFSKLIRAVESDSVLRLNHYPPSQRMGSSDGVGFGEHTDPQILTILRSNGAGGLQICTRDSAWVSVPPDPNAFFVMVGDALQVMTNGRFESVKHRVVVSSGTRRMSMMYFGAPTLDTRIAPLPQLVEPTKGGGGGCKYLAFTWSEYKKAAYASRLSDCRLDLFKRKQS